MKESRPLKKTELQALFHFKDIIRVLKMPVMWLIIIMMYTSYTLICHHNIFTLGGNIIGVTAVIAAILTVMSQYIRPFAATFGGFSEINSKKPYNDCWLYFDDRRCGYHGRYRQNGFG